MSATSSRCPSCGNPGEQLYSGAVVVDYCGMCCLGWQNPLPTEPLPYSVHHEGISKLGVRFEREDLITALLHARMGSVLEVGSGDCRLAEALAGKFDVYDCLDLHFPPLPPSGVRSLFTTTIEGFNTEEQYDAIISIGTLEHVVDVNSALLAMKAALKKDGVMLIEVPDLERPIVGVMDFFSREHVWYFTKLGFGNLAAKHRMTVVAMIERGPNLLAAIKNSYDGPPYHRARDRTATYEAARLVRIAAVTERVKGKRVLFGAGQCGQALMGLGMESGFVFDSDPAVRRRDSTVLRPEAMKDFKEVVIGSEVFAEEMAAKVRSIDPNIKIIRIDDL